MPEIEPFVLTVSGNAQIPHPAERALINVSVSSQGHNKAGVSDEVVTTAKHIESMLRALSPTDESAEAKDAAPLAHWDKTSLSSTSFIPHDNAGNPLQRQYNASVQFDIRFKEFKALGAFGTKISSLPHVELSNIDWILTDATEKSYRSRLRRGAAKDAMEKAKDYCEVLNCTNLRPVELSESGFLSQATSRKMRTVQAPQCTPFSMQAAPGNAFGGSQRLMTQMAPGGGSDYKEEDLEFRPQEVKMSMDVTIRFQADPS